MTRHSFTSAAALEAVLEAGLDVAVGIGCLAGFTHPQGPRGPFRRLVASAPGYSGCWVHDVFGRILLRPISGVPTFHGEISPPGIFNAD